MTHLRHDGYRYKHHGQWKPGDTFVADGWLCHRDRNTDKDRPVTIYHRPGVGYTYEEKLK
jgi:hypothetical protein